MVFLRFASTLFVPWDLNYGFRDHVRSDIKYLMFGFSRVPRLLFLLFFIFRTRLNNSIYVASLYPMHDTSRIFIHACQSDYLTNLLNGLFALP